MNNYNGYPASLAIVHYDTALRLTVNPADEHAAGDVVATIAPRSGNDTYNFSGDDAIDFHLDFDAVCKLLRVFRGETESVNSGEGLYDDDRGLHLWFRHDLSDPYYCTYKLDIGELVFRFSTSEALGVCLALEGVLTPLAFGVPTVLR